MSTGYGNSTTGLGVAAQVALLSPLNTPPGVGQTKPGGVEQLSLSSTGGFPNSFQIDCEVQDASGNALTGPTSVLTSVDSSTGTSPADAVYHGTITNGANNALVGYVFTVTGFVTHTSNNGTFAVVASTASTLTLANANAISETNAATATQETLGPLDYNILYGGALDGNVISVTTDGFVSALNVGHACVEVSYPFANNTAGQYENPVGSPPTGFNWPMEKIYREINFRVNL